MTRACLIVHGDVVCARPWWPRNTGQRILMLTASGTTQDLVDGLAELGADEASGKPLRAFEQARRPHPRVGPPRARGAGRVLERAGVRLDLGRRRLHARRVRDQADTEGARGARRLGLAADGNVVSAEELLEWAPGTSTPTPSPTPCGSR